MREHMKKIICLLLVCIVGFTGVSVKSEAKAYSWYFGTIQQHKAPGGAWTPSKLAKYDAYFRKPTNEKVIYLTFDCGYEAGYTNKILNTLKKHEAKATFFVTKPFIKTSYKACKRMKREGHFVGNHTVTHPNMTTKSNASLKKELKTVEKYFKAKTGYTLDKYMRPPMGCFSKRTLRLTKSLGYTSIFWSMAYYDYDTAKQPGKAYVIKYFKKNYHKGAIPLIHVVSSSNTRALDTVLTNLEKAGYRFGTLDELGE